VDKHTNKLQEKEEKIRPDRAQKRKGAPSRADKKRETKKLWKERDKKSASSREVPSASAPIEYEPGDAGAGGGKKRRRPQRREGEKKRTKPVTGSGRGVITEKGTNVSTKKKKKKHAPVFSSPPDKETRSAQMSGTAHCGQERKRGRIQLEKRRG